MGTAELVDRLGVSRQRVAQIVRRPDFPEPYDKLAGGWIWRREDVERWIKVYRPHLDET